MPDPRGSWFRVYARQVRQHPKFHALTLDEMGGWLVLRSECELLDGNPITDRDEALLILRRHKARHPVALLDKLLEVRLLDITDDGGYAIHDRQDHDRQKYPSDEAEETRKRKAAERERKAKEDASRDVTNESRVESRDVTTPAQARAEPAYESASEPAYEGGQDDPSKDPLTVICHLIGYWPKPADHQEYKVAVEEMARRYGEAWTLEAIPQAYALLVPRGRVRHWDLKRRAELILGERARSEELAIREADQERARKEREDIAAKQAVQSEEERERASLIRRAVKLWTHNKPDEPVPTDFDELRLWLEQNGATA